MVLLKWSRVHNVLCNVIFWEEHFSWKSGWHGGVVESFSFFRYKGWQFDSPNAQLFSNCLLLPIFFFFCCDLPVHTKALIRIWEYCIVSYVALSTILFLMLILVLYVWTSPYVSLKIQAAGKKIHNGVTNNLRVSEWVSEGGREWGSEWVSEWVSERASRHRTPCLTTPR